MLKRNEHDRLVAGLYASALGDAPWSGTLRDIAGCFGASKALLQVMDSTATLLGYQVHGYSTEFSEEFYRSDIYSNDPRLSYFHGVGAGQLYYDNALFDVEEMNRDARVRACVDALEVKYQLGAVMRLPDGARAWLTLLSSDAEGHATDAAIGAYRRLAPHISQALALGHVLEQHHATQTAMLEALAAKADGVVLVGRTGAPSFANEAARAVLAADDGLGWSRDGFVTRRGPETRRLQRLIGEAIAPASDSRPRGEMLVSRPSGRRPYVVRAMAVPRTERFLTRLSVAAMVFVHDLASLRLPPKAMLIAAFGLTERESDLAVELVRCASLAGAAANAGMALNTARNHLQGIFRKSGTASQAEAVQLFSCLA